MVAVRGARGEPGTECAGLVDAFLEDLAFLVLAVIHELIRILRRVELSLGGVDADLAEHAFHAEGARFVGNDRHDVLADLLVAHQRRQHAHECHRRRRLAIPGAFELRLENFEPRYLQRRRGLAARRQVTAE